MARSLESAGREDTAGSATLLPADPNAALPGGILPILKLFSLLNSIRDGIRFLIHFYDFQR